MGFMVEKCKTGYQFSLLAANGQSVAVGEVYSSEKACLRGVASVRENALAPVEDLTLEEASLPNPKFQLFLDKRGRFRFRLKARNGRIIAVSQSYRSKESCLEGIASLRENVNDE